MDEEPAARRQIWEIGFWLDCVLKVGGSGRRAVLAGGTGGTWGSTREQQCQTHFNGL